MTIHCRSSLYATDAIFGVALPKADLLPDMSADLGDLKRLKITTETRAWLAAEAHSSGRTQQEIARDALHEIATRRIHAARVLVSMTGAEGRGGDGEGHNYDGRRHK